MLAVVAETVRIGGEHHRLDCQEFRTPDHHHTLFPHGYQYLYRFDKHPSVVTWHFRVGPVLVTKQLRMVWKRQAAILTYTLAADPESSMGSIGPVGLKVTPLVAMRDFHQHRRIDWGDPFDVRIEPTHAGTRVCVHGGLPLPLYLLSEGALFCESRDWWYGFHHRRETERGQDDVEDLFAPGEFTREFDSITPGNACTLTLVASVESLEPSDLPADDGRAEHLGRAVRGIRSHIDPDETTDSTVAGLAAAADDFVVTRQVDGRECRTILAGYPWFSDWGRDTMISLPGLLLYTGRFDEAAQTLIAYARNIRRGLVPNRFDDYGAEPHYNTADGSLWFLHAALEYHRMSGDVETWDRVLAEACRQVIAAYQRGTDGPIGMDRDGLIVAGNEQTQLTWMDAKRDGVVFTPRHGTCVELNALWHRALRGCAKAMTDVDAGFADECDALAARVADAFNKMFWSDELGYLIDHANDQGTDPSLRPNQVLAVSLSGSLLSREQRLSVMSHIRQKLLTPRGLRTLPCDDSHYHGRHAGTMFDRDKAYHQGTVWPWLIGPYVEGWLRAHEYCDEARQHTRDALRPLITELGKHSVGQLHEVYDGDEPHRPSGCVAQAWSVAEVLRGWILTGAESAA